MKRIIVLVNVLMFFMLLFVNVGLAEVVQGSTYAGLVKSSKSGKSWSAVLKITKYDQKTGNIEGELEWPQLYSRHKIVGNVLDSKLFFKETVYIKKGGAFLNCEYNATMTDKIISGTWTYLTEDQGSFQLNRQTIPAAKVIPALDLTKTAWSGVVKSSKSGKSWNAILTFVKHDKASGKLEGKLEWTSLASVHKVVGQLNDTRISFKETEYIKKGSAFLNCQYTASLINNIISGSWGDPHGDKGTFKLTKK